MILKVYSIQRFWLLILILCSTLPIAAKHQGSFEQAVERYRLKVNRTPKNLDLHQEMVNFAVKSKQVEVPLYVYRKAQAKKPNSPLFCYLLAYTYFHSRRNIEQAIDLSQKVVTAQNDFWQAYQLLGECYMLKNNVQLAQQNFYQAVEIQPDAWPIKLQLAKLHLNQKDDQSALEYYQEVLIAQPRSASTYFQIGLILLRLNNLSEAKVAFQKSIRYDKNSASSYYQMGQIYALQQQPEKAIKEYRKGRQVDPNPKSTPRYQLASIFLQQEDGRNAILALRSGISLDPKYIEYVDQFKNVSTLKAARQLSEMLAENTATTDNDAFLHFFVAQLQIKINQLETARGHLEQVVVLKPDHAQAHALLGELYEESAPSTAIEAFEQSIEHGNTEVEMMVKLAEHYQKQKKNHKFAQIAEEILALIQHPEIHYQLALYYEEQALIKKQVLEKIEVKELENKALFHVDQAVKINPEVAKYNLKLGSYYDQRGKLKAIRFYEKAIQLEPQNPEGYYKRGLFMSNYTFGSAKVLLYAPEDVMSDLKKAIQLNPKSVGAHRAIGIVYDRMYNVSDAIAAFNKVVQLDPHDAYAQIYLAEKYANSGQIKRAIDALEQAIKGKPNDVEALKDYAFLSLKLNQDKLWKQAKSALEKAIIIRPDDAEILMNYGYTLYLNGEVEKAVEKYQRSIKLKPDWAITHYNLALAYERLRKYNLAKQAYRKVAEINPNSSLSDKSINRLTILGSK